MRIAGSSSMKPLASEAFFDLEGLSADLACPKGLG
jgi:hypothetical protein